MLPWGLGREALHGAGLAHTPALLGSCHLDRDKKRHKGQQEAFRVETWDRIGEKKTGPHFHHSSATILTDWPLSRPCFEPLSALTFNVLSYSNVNLIKAAL